MVWKRKYRSDLFSMIGWRKKHCKLCSEGGGQVYLVQSANSKFFVKLIYLAEKVFKDRRAGKLDSSGRVDSTGKFKRFFVMFWECLTSHTALIRHQKKMFQRTGLSSHVPNLADIVQ